MDNHKHCKNCGKIIEDVTVVAVKLGITLGNKFGRLNYYSWEQSICIDCLIDKLEKFKRTK